jgi:hypothetical protein
MRFEVFVAMRLQFVVFWFLRRIVWWLDISVSEDCAASVFRVHFSPTVLRNVGIQPPHYTMQKPENHEL